LKEGKKMRGFWMIVVGLAFVALLATCASADPWPSWNAIQPRTDFGVNVSQSGGLTYHTVTVTPPANGWSFRAFVPYVGNLDGLADPPGGSGYGYGYDGGNSLANDANWTSLNGGWEWGKLGATHWDQTHFALHVRQPNDVYTFWAGNCHHAVPEPTSMVLLGSGLALLLGVGLRRRHGH
jgi:hypothetical protein